MHEACASGAPWVSKSTHPRKFGNHVTAYRPPPPPVRALYINVVAPGCDQLAAVKTGFR